MNTIKLGSKGQLVIQLQKFLGLVADGDFGPLTEKAVINLLKLYQEHKIEAQENDLYSFFKVLKRYQLHYLFSSFYIIFKSVMKRNLIGKHPSVSLLQLYKISLMCNTYLKKSI